MSTEAHLRNGLPLTMMLSAIDGVECSSHVTHIFFLYAMQIERQYSVKCKPLIAIPNRQHARSFACEAFRNMVII